MPTDTLPVISLAEEPAALPARLGHSFRRFGFAVVRDHGIDPALISAGWRLTRRLFALPEAEKRAWFVPGQAGARGYTPFGQEIAKGADAADLKEFWHVGRELPAGHRLLGPSMPANVWPDRPAGFRETFTALFTAFDELGQRLLSCIAVDLGLSADWFAPAVADGNSVLRLLHYPPVPGATGPAIRAAAHEDINLITLLLGAEEAGLELLTRDRQWLALDPPADALVVNVGDMLQRLTNRALPSTTHRVRNPDTARATHSRYSMPFFVHLRSDFPITTLPQCISAEQPDEWPEPITADDFLQERLREIGLRA